MTKEEKPRLRGIKKIATQVTDPEIVAKKNRSQSPRTRLLRFESSHGLRRAGCRLRFLSPIRRYCTMWRILGALVLGAGVCSTGIMFAGADDQKIQGGIEGKIKSVDVEANTLTLTTTQGRERTFSITKETMMVGPRGGKVRRRLKDPRFQE